MIKITSMHEQCVKVNRQNNEELYIYMGPVNVCP